MVSKSGRTKWRAETSDHQRVQPKIFHCKICLEFRLGEKYNSSPKKQANQSCPYENFSVKQVVKKKKLVRKGVV